MEGFIISNWSVGLSDTPVIYSAYEMRRQGNQRKCLAHDNRNAWQTCKGPASCVTGLYLANYSFKKKQEVLNIALLFCVSAFQILK
jgi:hypothetical protein